MKQITLTLSENDAMIIRDALIDASVALRTISRPNGEGKVIGGAEFLKLDISDRKRERYLTARDYANRLNDFCRRNEETKMATKISIKRDSYSDTSFDVVITDDKLDERVTLAVATNDDGSGLWVNGKQIEGTCQFNGGRNPSAAIRRYFSNVVKNCGVPTDLYR